MLVASATRSTMEPLASDGATHCSLTGALLGLMKEARDPAQETFHLFGRSAVASKVPTPESRRNQDGTEESSFAAVTVNWYRPPAV